MGNENSSRRVLGADTTLYHYTSKQSADLIRKTCCITTASHTRYGPGTYFTDLSPDNHPQRVIEQENWNNTNMSEKMECVIVVHFKRGAHVGCVNPETHIWLHDGPVKLGWPFGESYEIRDLRESMGWHSALFGFALLGLLCAMYPVPGGLLLVGFMLAWMRSQEDPRPRELGYSVCMEKDGVLCADAWAEQNARRGLEVTCSAKGFDQECVEFKVFNRWTEQARFRVPGGALLCPSDSKQQNVVLRDHIDVPISPRSQRSVRAFGYCGNQERSTPAGDFRCSSYRLNVNLQSQSSVWATTDKYRA